MKQFIKNNRPYSQTDSKEYADKYISEGCVEVGIIYENNLINPIWNGTAFIEGATSQEITELQSEKYLQQETQRYEQRTIDGQKAYAKISAEFRLAKLAGLITEQAHGVVEKLLINVRNEILAGQWKSGLMELETLGNTIIGVDLYNQLHTQISDYVTISYPT